MYVLRTAQKPTRYFAPREYSDAGISSLTSSREKASRFSTISSALTALQRFYIRGANGEGSLTHIANFQIVRLEEKVTEEVVS